MAHRLVSCIREIESKRGNQNPRGLLCYDLKQSRMDSRWSHLTTLERCNVSFLAWYLPIPGSVVGRKDQKGEKRRGWNSKNWRGKRAEWRTLSPSQTTALLALLAYFFFPPSPGASGPRRFFFCLFPPLRDLVPSFFRIILRFCETAHLATPHLSQHFALCTN